MMEWERFRQFGGKCFIAGVPVLIFGAILMLYSWTGWVFIALGVFGIGTGCLVELIATN